MAKFYKLNYASLPDELFRVDVPVEKWLALATTTDDAKGFAPNSLHQLSPIPQDVERERLVGISLYMAGNVLPFALPFLLVAAVCSTIGSYVLIFVACYVAVLFGIANGYYKPKFLKHYQKSGAMTENIKDNQYLYTERNSCKYLSVNVVWPKSLHPPTMTQTPLLFCAVPHGVAPYGITAYPLWSKLWNDKLCHWTTAPIVLKIPIVAFFMRKIGYIPAKSKDILETLTKKEENVGVVLDGIAGMFQGSKEETAHILARKGIVKIALRAGTPIVPVYGFGHTSLYNVVVDPFGLLEMLSNKLDTALTPFFGRYGWFLGPPKRHPVTVCLGEPILCPQMAEPTQADIDLYHKKMLASFQQVFEQHKTAYGWADKKLKFV
jgi:1-acyl-sn-glycerol-3-phosphate acyltransferase